MSRRLTSLGYEIKPMEDFYIQCDAKKLAEDSAL